MAYLVRKPASVFLLRHEKRAATVLLFSELLVVGYRRAALASAGLLPLHIHAQPACLVVVARAFYLCRLVPSFQLCIFIELAYNHQFSSPSSTRLRFPSFMSFTLFTSPAAHTSSHTCRGLPRIRNWPPLLHTASFSFKNPFFLFSSLIV